MARDVIHAPALPCPTVQPRLGEQAAARRTGHRREEAALQARQDVLSRRVPNRATTLFQKARIARPGLGRITLVSSVPLAFCSIMPTKCRAEPAAGTP
jgi:hypothetical protein